MSVEGSHEYSITPNLENKFRRWPKSILSTIPIAGTDIPNFKSWICSGGFKRGHEGYDFATYLTDDNKIILGLPIEAKVRAIADGIMKPSFTIMKSNSYGTTMILEHQATESYQVFSTYTHVVPEIKFGQQIKKGDPIATLYKDPGEDVGRMVHLHLELLLGKWDPSANCIRNHSWINPGVQNWSLYQYIAKPEESVDITVEGLPDVTIEQAHFRQIVFAQFLHTSAN